MMFRGMRNNNQTGGIMLLALIAIILVGALAAVTFNRTNFSEERSGQARQKDKSELAADAALQMAIRNIQRVGSASAVEDAKNCSILDGPKPDNWGSSSVSDSSNNCVNPPAPLMAQTNDKGTDYSEATPLLKEGEKYKFGSYKGFLNGVDASDGTYNYVVRGGSSGTPESQIPAGYAKNDIQNGVCGWPSVPDSDPFPKDADPEEQTDGRIVRQITAYGYYKDKCAKRTLRFLIVPRAFRFALYTNGNINMSGGSSLLVPPAYKGADNSRGGDLGSNGQINFQKNSAVNQRTKANCQTYDQNFRKQPLPRPEGCKDEDFANSENKLGQFYGASLFAPWGSVYSPRESSGSTAIKYDGADIRGNTPTHFPVKDNDTGLGSINFDGNIVDLANRTLLPQYDQFVSKYRELNKKIQVVGGTDAPQKGTRGINMSAEYFQCLVDTVKNAPTGGSITRTNCPNVQDGNGNANYHNKTLIKPTMVSLDPDPKNTANTILNYKQGNPGTTILQKNLMVRNSDGTDTDQIVLPIGISLKPGEIRLSDSVYSDAKNEEICSANPNDPKCDVNGEKQSLPRLLYIDNRTNGDDSQIHSCKLDLKKVSFYVKGSVVIDGCDLNVPSDTSFGVSHLMDKENSITHQWPGLMVLRNGAEGGNITIEGLETTNDRVVSVDGLLFANESIKVSSVKSVPDDQTKANLNVNGAVVAGNGDKNGSGTFSVTSGASAIIKWNPLVQRTLFDPTEGRMGTYSIRTDDTPKPDKPIVTIDKTEGKVPDANSTYDYIPMPFQWSIVNGADSVRCSLRKDGTAAPKLLPCQSPPGFVASGLSRASGYTFRVVACNISGCSEDSYSWRVKPEIPTVKITQHPDLSQPRDTDSTFKWSVGGGTLPMGQSSMECQIAAEGWKPCGTINTDGSTSNTSITYSNRPKGTYRFQVKVCNELQLKTPQCAVDEWTWTLMPLKPNLQWTQIPAASQSNTGTENTRDQTFKFKVTGGDAVANWTCKANGTVVTPCPGTLTNGEYTITRNFNTCDQQTFSVIAENDAGKTQIDSNFRVSCARPVVRFTDATNTTDWSPNWYSSGQSAPYFTWKTISGTSGTTGAGDCKITIVSNDEGLPGDRIWYCKSGSGGQTLGSGSWNGTSGGGSLGLGGYCNNIVYQLQVRNESGWSDPVTIRMHRNCTAPVVNASYNGAILNGDGTLYSRWDYSMDWTGSRAGSIVCATNRWGGMESGRCNYNRWWPSPNTDPGAIGLGPWGTYPYGASRITEYFGSYWERNEYRIRATNADGTASACREMSHTPATASQDPYDSWSHPC